MSRRAPDFGLFRVSGWALQYAANRKGPLILVLGTMLVKVALDVLRPWPMVFLVDYVLKSSPLPGALRSFVEALPGPASPGYLIGWSVVATVAIFLMGWGMGVLAAFANINLAQRMTYDLAAELFAKLQRLSLHFHTRKSVGDNVRRVTADCTAVSTIVKDALLPVIASAVTLGAMFFFMCRINISLTLVALAVAPYMVLVFKYYARPMMERSYGQQEAEGKLYEIVEQTFSAIPVVQAFGRERANELTFQNAGGAAMAATLSATALQMKFKFLIGLATAGGTAGILWIGAQHALQGTLSVGQILLFLSYLAALYTPLEAIMYTTSTIQGASGSARRVMEILETEGEVEQKSGAATLQRSRGEVRFEAVTFGYAKDQPALREIDFHVKPGETIALVGPSGAGKTTLVSLLPRFFDPWHGRILIDGQDMRDVTLKSLREQVAVVLQEPFLFPMSVAENIAYGKPRASLEEIIAAAKAANAHEFIQRLPNGYSTIVGERGATLSGGERQRISIARAFLKNAPILILDEPTSALDTRTEQALLDALDKLTEGRTTFIIAHRLSTVQRADRIIVLEAGQIVESGTHDELLKLGGTYARFHALQFSGTHNPPIDKGS